MVVNLKRYLTVANDPYGARAVPPRLAVVRRDDSVHAVRRCPARAYVHAAECPTAGECLRQTAAPPRLSFPSPSAASTTPHAFPSGRRERHLAANQRRSSQIRRRCSLILRPLPGQCAETLFGYSRALLRIDADGRGTSVGVIVLGG